MKSIFFIIVLVTTNYSFSQGNLQFSQVYNYLGSTIPVYGPYGSVSHWSITYTVPLNKVWRIEYMTANQNQNLYINDLFASSIIVNGTATYPPIWVREGNTIKVGTYANVQSNYHINIVEFNIIP
jgi:hypothetical protein